MSTSQTSSLFLDSGLFEKWSTTSHRHSAFKTLISGIKAASFAFSAGTTTCFIPISFNPVTIGKIPFTALKEPSKDNSPRKAVSLIDSLVKTSSSANIPMAIGRS